MPSIALAPIMCLQVLDDLLRVVVPGDGATVGVVPDPIRVQAGRLPYLGVVPLR